PFPRVRRAPRKSADWRSKSDAGNWAPIGGPCSAARQRLSRLELKTAPSHEGDEESEKEKCEPVNDSKHSVNGYVSFYLQAGGMSSQAAWLRLDIAEVPDNPRVRSITHALPEGRRPGMVLFNQGNKAPGPSGDQPLFDRPHQNTGDPPPPKSRMDSP